MSAISNIENSKLQERLAFHGVTQDLKDALRENSAYIIPILKTALDAFYDHIAIYPTPLNFFCDAAHIDHVKCKQLEHWRLLIEGNFDCEYVASVNKIGQIHHKIGLDITWYIGGYSYLLRLLIKLIADEKAKSGIYDSDVIVLQQALVSVIMFDMDCAVEIYVAAGMLFLD